jgi:hypothetical protein
VQEVIRGCGHEVLVANPRLMDGSKRRKRKNDRIDANKLARLGGVDPESLHPIQHRSREVRQDLVMLRARTRESVGLLRGEEEYQARGSLGSSEITLWAVRQESLWRDRCACFARWLAIPRVLDVNRDLAHLWVNELVTTIGVNFQIAADQKHI